MSAFRVLERMALECLRLISAGLQVEYSKLECLLDSSPSSAVLDHTASFMHAFKYTPAASDSTIPFLQCPAHTDSGLGWCFFVFFFFCLMSSLLPDDTLEWLTSFMAFLPLSLVTIIPCAEVAGLEVLVSSPPSVVVESVFCEAKIICCTALVPKINKGTKISIIYKYIYRIGGIYNGKRLKRKAQLDTLITRLCSWERPWPASPACTFKHLCTEW